MYTLITMSKSLKIIIILIGTLALAALSFIIYQKYQNNKIANKKSEQNQRENTSSAPKSMFNN